MFFGTDNLIQFFDRTLLVKHWPEMEDDSDLILILKRQTYSVTKEELKWASKKKLFDEFQNPSKLDLSQTKRIKPLFVSFCCKKTNTCLHGFLQHR